MYTKHGRIHQVAFSVVLNCVLISAAVGQKVTYGPDEGVTNADPGDYSLNYGSTEHYPPNYDYYYYGQRYVRPVVVATPSPTPWVSVEQQVETEKAPVIGYVKPYSDAQYGEIVIQQMNAERAAEGLPAMGAISTPVPSTTPMPTPSSPQSTAATPFVSRVPSTGPALRAATIASVLDRGVLVTSRGLQIRLRGVTFPSTATKDPKRRQLAGSAVASLRDLVVGKRIYFVVERPPRGLDGRVLAIVHLGDGTQLNRLVLESGMAFFDPGDFPDESVADGLMHAEANARKAQRGFWAAD